MTIYEQPRSEVFAQDAPESEIKPFSAWLRGLGIAFDETNGYPEMESFNGLLNALNTYIKYLEQNGFAEWRGDLEYPIGAGVRVAEKWYKAKTRNTDKPPATSQNDWLLFADISTSTVAEPLYFADGKMQIRTANQERMGVVKVQDNLTTNSATDALSAKQAGVLKGMMIGVDQTWQDVTAQRRTNSTSQTPYFGTWKNETTRPIEVSISAQGILSFYVDGVRRLVSGNNDWNSGSSKSYASVTMVIPAGSTYALGSFTNFLANTIIWSELR